MRIFLLGLDGMTLKVIEPYVRENLLPNFKKLIEQGAYGVLRSTIPSITGPAWTSLSTGKNPGKHGVFEFRQRVGYKTSIITKATSPQADPLWKILSRKGKHVSVINVPFTYPPDPVNGIMISGMMTPGENSDFTYPKAIKDELLRMIPDYQLELDITDLVLSQDRQTFLEEVCEITEHTRRMLHHYYAANGWDLFFITFIGPDRIQHMLWEDVLAMNPDCVRYYQYLDRILGEVLNKIDDDTVLFVASDHGFRSVKRAFNINAFFRKQGWLKVRGDLKTKIMPIAGPIFETFMKSILSMFSRYFPPALRGRLKNFVLWWLGNSLSGKGLENKLDWDHTQVCSLLTYGAVTINLRGREPNGIVSPRDYDDLCNRVRNALLEIRDPQTNGRVVRNVYTADEIYSGATDIFRPDLVVELHHGYFFELKDFGDQVLKEDRRFLKYPGDHEREGVFFAYGPHILNRRIDADISDIMPTILYLLETAVPEDVDGRVLTEIIDETFLKSHSVESQENVKHRIDEPQLSRAEEKELERRLRQLGYLD